MADRVLGPGDDLEMITNPDLWPMWPYLPMKRRVDSSIPESGFFYSTSLRGNTVVFYEGNMITAKSANKTDLTPEQVLAAGWIVD